jgi:hypothetical protein
MADDDQTPVRALVDGHEKVAIVKDVHVLGRGTQNKIDCCL